MKCTKTLKTIFFGIVILLLMFSFVPFNFSGYALIDLDKCSTHTGKITHYVGGYGPGNYTYIQDAIDNASAYDHIFVYCGIYYENLIIDIPLTLIGESSDLTIIHGSNTGDIPCIRVLADNVSIMNLKIIWADWEFHEPGIEIYSHHVFVKNNNISLHDKGIILFPSAKYCLIDGNVFSNVHEGIYFWAPGTHYHKVVNNTFINNDIGMKVFSTTNNVIKNNTFENHGFQAVYLRNAKYNEIYENTFIDNAMGLIIEEQSNQNQIFHNNFIDNTYHAFDNGENDWDKGQNIGGNFWDDYENVDENNDTFGDQPRQINGGSNYDNYPLLQKNQWEMNSLDVEIEYINECFVNQSIQFQLFINEGREPYFISWDFGDDIISNLQNPVHSYAYPGVFDGSVTVKDGQNNHARLPFRITVFKSDFHPPSISIDVPRPGIYVNCQEQVSFSLFPLILIIGDVPLKVNCFDEDTYVVNMSISNSIFFEVEGHSIDTKIDSLDSGFHQLEIRSFDFAGNMGYKQLNFFKI